MKRTINVNLGGQPFIIDEPAYDILHAYFEALKQKFINENERKEILSDIEARVAEVFTQRLGKTRAVVAEEDVVYIISLMGRPEDIAGEQEGTTQADNAASTVSSTITYTGPKEKKFFRDPDNKKVGGVISGLCHYFGWGDPTWIRIGVLAIVLLSMFAGFGIGAPIAVIYLILLIVVPEASTGAEKLQMRGEPVTLQNIEKQVRDAMTTAGTSIRIEIEAEGTGNRLMQIFVAVIKGFAKFVSIMLLIACACIMLFFLSSLFGYSVISGISLSEIGHLFVSNESLLVFFYIGATLVIFIPLIAIMYDVIRFLANSKVKNPMLKRLMWILWVVAIIMLLGVGLYIVKGYNAADTTTTKIALTTPAGGNLHIQMADGAGHLLSSENQDHGGFSTSNLFHISPERTENGFAFFDIELEVTVSPDSNYHLEKIYYSRGFNSADALHNIEGMRYMLSQRDSMLNLDNKFEIPRRGQWRMQTVKVRIYVPEGGKISFGENIEDLKIVVKNKDRDYDRDALKNQTLEVQNGKLTCEGCNETIEVTGPDDDADDDDKSSSGNTSKNNIHISKDGKTDDLKDVSVKVNQNGVVVTGKNDKDEKVKLKVTDEGVKVITTDSLGHTTIVKHHR